MWEDGGVGDRGDVEDVEDVEDALGGGGDVDTEVEVEMVVDGISSPAEPEAVGEPVEIPPLFETEADNELEDIEAKR